jgi:hypothetical protein
MVKKDIKPTEYNEYYKRYIDKVSNDTNLINGLDTDKKNGNRFLFINS